MSGEFLQTCQSGGNLYGVTRQSVEELLERDWQGVLSFKNTYFEPRYVLILPQSRQYHEKHLRDSACYSEAQIAYELDRVEVYAQTNREKPGFFDSVIVSDDMTESYRKLKHVIMEYLGLSPAVSTESTFTSSFAETLTSGEVSDHEYSTTSGSVKVPGKSWSRRSEPVSNTSRKNTSRTPAQIQPVEQSSIERRQILAKAAVAGLHSLPQEQVENIRKSLSADVSKAKSRLQSSEDDFQRASTAPVKYNLSNISMLVNGSSTGEETGLEPRVPSEDESDSDAGSGRSSSILSSAHAYSVGGTQMVTKRPPCAKVEDEGRPESGGSADVSMLSDTPAMPVTSNSI